MIVMKSILILIFLTYIIFLSNTGESVINSTISINLTSGESIFVFIAYNYTNVSLSDKAVAIAYKGSFFDIEGLNDFVPDLNMTNSLVYDANGNLIQDSRFYYEYNNFNQLKRVREGNATSPIIEEYMYDHEGQRILKQTGSETTFYISENFVRVSNSSGVFDTVYYYDEKDLVARKDPDGKKFFYHPDHLGSTTLITNESGDVIEEVTYEPFGKLIESSDERFLYTGKELDRSTSLQYYGARYYSPELGRFVEPDSNLPNVYDPQQLNRYSYVRNNPYKYTDPDGNFINIAAGAGIGAAVGFGFYALTHLDNFDLADAGKAAAVGTVAGAVGGATMGGSLIVTALGGTAAGQAARATGNVLEGQNAATGLGNPFEMGFDAATAGVASKVTPYAQKAGGQIAERLGIRSAASNMKSGSISELPQEAQETIKSIEKGGPFPFKQDASVFRNEEGLLPLQGKDYYKEYTVPTQGIGNRGTQRIVSGGKGEMYYTKDHYKTFIRIGGKKRG